jgi:glycosyltransferase involved in cell wall biosynthesis
MEAMAAALPVVGSDVPGIRELVIHGKTVHGTELWVDSFPRIRLRFFGVCGRASACASFAS